ncbi:Solute carrier family 22 member 18 [Toxocara canis]|uniref:Solute carrier family 22 member 18 n=1 Tax=Toxocara canis TaxID=6265 RepID=A0A0B2VLV0_TOXCA|nr:Solute carrier family 22 member 18 [Toxocara canis]
MIRERDQSGDQIHSNPNFNKMWRIPFTSLTVRSSIAIAYSLSMLYNVGFFMQMMILPYAAKELSISDTDFGLIQTFFGAMQMIGGPIYGYLIRQFGIQKALVICYSCTAASSLLIFTARVGSIIMFD